MLCASFTIAYYVRCFELTTRGFTPYKYHLNWLTDRSNKTSIPTNSLYVWESLKKKEKWEEEKEEERRRQLYQQGTDTEFGEKYLFIVYWHMLVALPS